MPDTADAIAGFGRHGGRLCVARALYPQVTAPWIDLSTGINPTAYPAPYATALARNRLPEPTALQELEAIAGAAFGVSAEANIAAVGGTESAVRLLPHVLAVDAAIVVEPTYASHASAWGQSNVVSSGSSLEALPGMFERPTAVTIVNPNNPDGRMVSRDALRTLHDRVASSGGVLIVDEAFADIDPTMSVAEIAGSDSAPRMIVLRSFGKFFGLAGVRLGFVIASPSLIRSLRNLLGDWPVSVDAIAAGMRAYADRAWIARMREQLQEQAQRMDGMLTGAGFRIVGGTSLYRLASAPDARQRFVQLLSQGVLTRPFTHDATLLRFGLPGRDEWQRVSDIMGGA